MNKQRTNSNKKNKNLFKLITWLELLVIFLAGLKLFVLEVNTLDLQKKLWMTVSSINTLQITNIDEKEKIKLNKAITGNIMNALGTGTTYCLTPATEKHPKGVTFSIRGLNQISNIMATIGNKKVPCKKVWFENEAGAIGSIKKTENKIFILDIFFWVFGLLLIVLKIKRDPQ